MTRWRLLLCVLWVAPGLANSNAVSQGERVTALRAVIEHLLQEYVDPAVGVRAARKLQDDADSGRFDSVHSGEAYARAISDALQQHTGDGHLNLEYSASPLDAATADPAFEAAQLERWYGAGVNHGVERIERLAGNVALLDLRVFAPLAMGAETVTAAMTVVAAADALIIDLRHNGGGIGATANLVASYLFDSEPQPLTGTYHRPSNTLEYRHTQPYVPGRRFGPDKPVYVLISTDTFSAAEALAYDLQALERAQIIGERSGGGAHPFEYRPVSPHFVLWSVTARSVNPITGGNWQGVGVIPDVPVAADQALARALELIGEQRSN